MVRYMNCPNCHKQNRPGLLLCEFCGHQLITLSEMSRYKTGALGAIEIPWKPYTPGETTPDKPQTGVLHEAPFITLEVVESGEKLRLKTHGHISLGRADTDSSWQPTVDLTPYGAVEKGVSRMHADLFFENDQVFVLELGSANGTRVNGVRVQIGLAQQLCNGDKLELGGLHLRVAFN
jgi:pSer/pThr/pTyr-binding forkhead associated (FHA) protein